MSSADSRLITCSVGKPCECIMTETPRLFKLPGELRNRILEYALTSSEPLRYNSPMGSSSRSSFYVSLTKPDGTMISHEFNVIKYVNRQLYAETAGLEIKLNTLHFSFQIGIEWSPAQHFFSFICFLAPTKRMWLRHVVVHNYMRNFSKYAVLSWRIRHTQLQF
jgi:hypothetical protein